MHAWIVLRVIREVTVRCAIRLRTLGGESEPVSVCVRAGGNREDADLVGRGMQCIAGFPRDWTAVFAVAYVGVGCRVLRSMGPYTGAWVVIVNSGNVSSLGGGMQMLRVQ
jgi:hypothetical protein